MISFFKDISKIKWYWLILAIIGSILFMYIVYGIIRSLDVRRFKAGIFLLPIIIIFCSTIALIIKVIFHIHNIIISKDSTPIQRIGILLFIPSIIIFTYLFFDIADFDARYRSPLSDFFYFRYDKTKFFWYSSMSLIISILMLNNFIDSVLRWIKSGQKYNK